MNHQKTVEQIIIDACNAAIAAIDKIIGEGK